MRTLMRAIIEAGAKTIAAIMFDRSQGIAFERSDEIGLRDRTYIRANGFECNRRFVFVVALHAGFTTVVMMQFV